MKDDGFKGMKADTYDPFAGYKNTEDHLKLIKSFKEIDEKVKGERKMASLKIKLVFEFDEEQLQDLFESYEVKFTKKRMTELKREINECGIEADMESDVEQEIENFLGDLIARMFDE